MGQLISLVCPDCGFQSNSIQVGSTFLDEAMHGPAYDTRNNILVEANYTELQHNKDLIPYSDARLRKIPEGAEQPGLFTWEKYEFWDKYNFCPSCNGFTLEVDKSEVMFVD